ncbi:hypothetical protein Cni_G22241 [Canna indica]|uniref:CCHC-type domain-containing protein n=1 Tax=Canna indica TaxID=4628 RepID=A0AAQ3QLG9_9LILI|nr:hypothetical protein Cni_G22241 [Canna indica]
MSETLATRATSRAFIPKPKKPPDPSDPRAEIASSSKIILPPDVRKESADREDKADREQAVQQKRMEGMQKKLPSSWAGLFNMARKEVEWKSLKDLNAKIERIQESSKWKVFIAEEDLEKVRNECKLILYEFFQPLKGVISVIPVWIQLPVLPLEFMHELILPQIATAIGKPVKIDDVTLSRKRGKFARICILLDIKKPIQQGIWVETEKEFIFQSIAYENLPKLCFSCGKVGHYEQECEVERAGKSEKKEEKHEGKEIEIVEDIYGPWIQVQKRKRNGVKNSNKNEGLMKNSFMILNNPTFEKSEDQEKSSVDKGKNIKKEDNVLKKMEVDKNVTAFRWKEIN